MPGFCTWTSCAGRWVDAGLYWACDRMRPASESTWTDPESKWEECHKASTAGASKETINENRTS